MTPKYLTILALSCSITTGAFAGKEIIEAKDKYVPEVECRTIFPDEPLGLITVGGLFSEHLTGVYFDSNTALWAPCDRTAVLFLSSRYSYEDNGQFISSTGLTFRKMLTGPEIILGFNGFYDSIHSDRGHDYPQLGLGFEILTRWVDARVNYYLPDNEVYEVDRLVQRDSGSFGNGGTVTDFERKRTFRRYEAALEGFNAEIGVLIPGLDEFMEVRVFGGYHHYNNPFGGDFEGFQGRVEARILPGVIADVEYWDDAALMGGHWTAGVRVSVPFSLYALATGRNPFEGIEDQFKFRPREFKERMSEMVMRSHRIKTVTSDRVLTNDNFAQESRLLAPGEVAPPGVAPGVPLE